MRIDVPDAENLVSTLLVKGRYNLEIISAKANEEYGFFNVGMQVLDGPDQENGSSSAGRKHYETVNYDVSKARSEKHKEFIPINLANFMAACGFDLADEGFDTEDLIGVELQATIGVREYNDEVSNQVRVWHKKK